MAQDFTQSSSSLRPIASLSDADFNNQKVLSFNGTSQYMTNSGTPTSDAIGPIFSTSSGWNAHTVYIVLGQEALVNGFQQIIYCDSGTSAVQYEIGLYQVAGEGLYAWVEAAQGLGNVKVVAHRLFDTNADKIYIAVRCRGLSTDNELELFVNSEQSFHYWPDGKNFCNDLGGLALDNTTFLGRNPISSAEYFKGKIADIFIYGQAHTDAVMGEMFQWMYRKFGALTPQGWGYPFLGGSPTVADLPKTTINSDTSMNWGNNVTLCGWMKFTTLTGFNLRYLATRYDGSGPYWWVFVGESAVSTAFRYEMQVSFSDGTTNLSLLTTGDAIAVNTWQHWAFIRNGTSFKLYIDGVEEASTTNGSFASSVVDTAPVTFGGRWDNAANRQSSAVQKEIAQFPRSISTGTGSELESLVNGTKKPDELTGGSPSWYLEMDPSKAQTQTTTDVGGLTMSNNYVSGVYL